MSERHLPAAAGLLLALLAGHAAGETPAETPVEASAQSITWPERSYNPAPADRDLVLPLPCGGAMTFRPVEIPSGDLLDDRPVELGHADAERGYKEGRRLSHLAGAFSDGQSAVRRYYIAKYETTLDQYAALTGASCADPTPRGRQPATEVSWFDAVDFARRYTEWLLANAPDALPREEREPGFLRLPTEEEWEFAARGGLEVDEADFLAPMFPMPEGDPARYAWFESTRSAQGRLHPIGLLKPNPLGLHDVLGNAAEMTLVPFHLDRRGRPHGQSGGFVGRGGDIFTPESQLGTAVRQEHNYFDARTGRAKSLDSLGFRLVMAAPVIVSPERLDAIRAAWSVLPTLMGEGAGDANAALADLKQLAETSRDEALRSRLELIQRDMERAQAGLAEARGRTVRALLRMGAFLGKRVITDRQRAKAVEQLIALAEQRFEAFAGRLGDDPNAQAAIAEARKALEDRRGKWQAQLEEIRASLANSLSYYGDMVIGVGRDYAAAEIEAGLPVVLEELRLRQNAYLAPYAVFFARHMDAYRRDGRADKEGWLEDLDRIEETRAPAEASGGDT
jgi:hypothetical protein